MFLRYQFIVLLDADVAVFPQCELAVPTGIQVGDQRFHDFAPAVFIPNARIDGSPVGRDIGLIVLFRTCFGQRHDFEQVTFDGCVLAKCDVCMVESIYIVKPDYATRGAELIAKADINTLIQEAGMTPSEGFMNFSIKMWSGVTVGDDGKMYIGFQKNDDPTTSGLLCLTSDAVKGPGTSEWPMFGVDRKHTGVQK